MSLNYLDILYLNCLNQFGGERSPSAVYHLLKGKKSSQTIQDSKLFHLSNLFGMYPSLPREKFDADMKRLISEGYLYHDENDAYVLTYSANNVLVNTLNTHPIPSSLNGTIYGSGGFVFWKRLMLITQVLSHDSAGSKKYLPVTKDERVLGWVKQFLKRSTVSKKRLSELIHNELLLQLQAFTKREAEIFVYRLTSHDRIGSTFEQLAEIFNEDADYIKITFWNIIHRMMEQCMKPHSPFPMLFQMIRDLSKVNPLTESTSKTLQLIHLGKSLEEISNIRNLKHSTIEDHVVEIALNDGTFDISMFLNDDHLLIIADKIKELQTHQLRAVKEALHDEYSYFQIRLAFTRIRRQS
ncbi:helix-turn-helix domain-containing protein [Metabacillus idriensis]|uniref:helix-turn-helix domain-containing protein n=1 Tax=Metabacillus idriensis TaxID=324768 RepID=UPI00163B07A7|nr:helix-turn-helix domain-containing protein [Metabacillus idriensis]QNG61400.1 helix-turn-helix domain-containing protein [Bacillus sp. PAMC26568]